MNGRGVTREYCASEPTAVHLPINRQMTSSPPDMHRSPMPILVRSSVIQSVVRQAGRLVAELVAARSIIARAR